MYGLKEIIKNKKKVILLLLIITNIYAYILYSNPDYFVGTFFYCKLVTKITLS